MEQGIYDLSDLELEDLRKKVIPYDLIIKAAKQGKGYVLDDKIKRTTIINALPRLNKMLSDDNIDVAVKLMKLKNGQYVVVPIDRRGIRLSIEPDASRRRR